jgi:hypothetical protein
MREGFSAPKIENMPVFLRKFLKPYDECGILCSVSSIERDIPYSI